MIGTITTQRKGNMKYINRLGIVSRHPYLRTLTIFFIFISLTSCSETDQTNQSESFVYPLRLSEKAFYEVTSEGENVIFAGGPLVDFDVYDSNNNLLGRYGTEVVYLDPGSYNVIASNSNVIHTNPNAIVYYSSSGTKLRKIESGTPYVIMTRDGDLRMMELSSQTYVIRSASGVNVNFYDGEFNNVENYFTDDTATFPAGTYYVAAGNANSVVDGSYLVYY